MPLQIGDFTGTVERAWILEQLKTLVGGRVWETQVPDNVSLPRDANGALAAPYIIMRSSATIASSQGRNIASGEQGQPHLLSITVLAIGPNADWVHQTIIAAQRLLVGHSPSLTSSPLVAKGGFSWDKTESGSRPSRYESAAFFRTIVLI